MFLKSIFLRIDPCILFEIENYFFFSFFNLKYVDEIWRSRAEFSITILHE